VPERDPEVPRITDAEVPLSVEQAGRTRRYLISMGIRTACLVGAVLAPSPWRWILVVGAIVLPWFAVVVANAGRERSDRSDVSVIVVPKARRALGGGGGSTPG
jgi:Flp pilus assembly protein TadB